MKYLKELFSNNRRWAENIKSKDPEFFKKLSRQQAPQYLWIGCSDSRVPANEIVGLLPGELFVHRNVANLVIEHDLNCLTVLNFAVGVLKVKHIIICGHYNCGGVAAAITKNQDALIDNWLVHLRKLYNKNKSKLSQFTDQHLLVNKLCEINVKEQVLNVSKTQIVQQAWNKKQELFLHGWIYDIADGLLQDLDVSVSGQSELERKFGF
jgi:carbonic anhydrase